MMAGVRHAVLFVALLACGGSTEPAAVVYPVASLSGEYTVTFTATGSQPASCRTISLDMTTMRWLPLNCSNPAVVPDFSPAAVTVRNDSMFLHVTSTPNVRDIALGYFNTQGSTDVIHALWRGMYCHPTGDQATCRIELGTATLRRPSIGAGWRQLRSRG